MFSDPVKGQRIFNAIWENTSLRNNLFGDIPVNQLDLIKDSKKTLFDGWVNNLDPKLYNFIKVQ